jgi:hypothetical protein
MRKSILLASALALLPLVPAAALQPAPAAKAELTSEQTAELQLALTRGRALAVLNEASRVATRSMLDTFADPAAAGITGWIAQPEGNGVTVTFYAQEGDNYRAVYRAPVIGGRVTSPQQFATAERPLLAGPAARMAAARTAAEAVELQPCGPDFNPLISPARGRRSDPGLSPEPASRRGQIARRGPLSSLRRRRGRPIDAARGGLHRLGPADRTRGSPAGRQRARPGSAQRAPRLPVALGAPAHRRRHRCRPGPSVGRHRRGHSRASGECCCCTAVIRKSACQTRLRDEHGPQPTR